MMNKGASVGEAPDKLMDCWTCKYQQKGGMTLLGFCKYWEEIGEEKKEIPPHIVDRGCKYYKEKT